MSGTEKPRRNAGTFCPLWRRDVSKVCHTCEWYILVRGSNPQTDEMVDNWGCSIAFMPILQVENAQQARQAGASSDKVATEVAKVKDAVDKSANVNIRIAAAEDRARRLPQQYSSPMPMQPVLSVTPTDED